jgi:hypothetical protein
MDSSNPAVSQQMNLSPAMLEAVGRDHRILVDIAKKMSLVQLDSLHRAAGNPNLPMGQKIQIAELTMKVADLFPRAAAANVSTGTPFSVNIVFSNKTPPPNIGTSNVTTVDAVAREVLPNEH